MSVVTALLSWGTVANAILFAIPLALAALGGAITERSGVVDLALEAKLLCGAFAGAAIGHATGSAGAEIIAAIAAGAMVALAQAAFALWLRADQVIVGIALNIAALSGTRFLLQLLYGATRNSAEAPSFGDAIAGDPLFWLAVVAAVALPFALRRTRWGLRLRAAGDRPDALAACGASTRRTRVAAMVVGGCLAGAGGAQLALQAGGFGADMSDGRGYIALAMIILAGWRPSLAAAAAFAICLVSAAAYELQHAGVGIPHELAPILPHLFTLAVLALRGRRGPPPPRALGS